MMTFTSLFVIIIPLQARLWADDTWIATLGAQGNENNPNSKQLFDGNNNPVVAHDATELGVYNAACQSLYGEDPEPVDYCNPAPVRGSVADWVPADVNCVEFTVATTCGEVTANIIDKTQYNTWDVSWSVGAPDWNSNTALPAQFAEGYNGGSVDVYYWLVGPEQDYVLDRGIFNYWEESPGMVTVDTDCEENEDVIPTEPEVPTTPQVPVLGTTTDQPRVLNQYVPEMLPQTGASGPVAESANALWVLLAGLMTYAALYFAQPRRETNQI